MTNQPTPPFPPSIDFADDPLAFAQLTTEQRQIWQSTRAALMMAHSTIHDLELRVKQLERAADDAQAQPVLNRPEFNREVARMLAFDERYGGTSSVLYFDFENMGQIMADHGRAMGDAAIRVICDVLGQNIRRSDILGRLATDEFGVLLARCPNDAAWIKAESLAALLFQHVGQIAGLALPPKISYGAYTFRDKEDVSTGLQQAAQSMTRTPR